MTNESNDTTHLLPTQVLFYHASFLKPHVNNTVIVEEPKAVNVKLENVLYILSYPQNIFSVQLQRKEELQSNSTKTMTNWLPQIGQYLKFSSKDAYIIYTRGPLTNKEKTA